MKKLVTIITALVAAAALAISASAAGFIPSVVQRNAAPEVVSAAMGGSNVELRTTNMENATGDIKAALQDAYEDLSQNSVTDLVSSAELQTAAGSTPVDDLVVESLFDASLYQDGVVINTDGSVTFTIKTDLAPGTAVVVLHYFNGTWEVIPAQNVALADNGNLTITCPHGLSPFVLLVDSAVSGSSNNNGSGTVTSPKTGEAVSIGAVAGCAGFVVLAGAVFVMGRKKAE